MSEQIILNIAGVNKRFGGLQALTDVGITIKQGQIWPDRPQRRRQDDVLQRHHGPVPARHGHFELAGKPYSPSAPHKVAKAASPVPSRTSACSAR
jgi:branched-chain amino acid transport system ATP-binding protein